MPLVWTHAEYLKLLIARESGKPVELLEVVEARYGAKARDARTWHWRTEAPFTHLAAGRNLVIEHRGPFTLHYGFDGWQAVNERAADRGLFGLWSVTFTPAELAPRRGIDFTRRFDADWEGTDYRVTLGHTRIVHALTHQPE
jgi:glucoamylase